MVGHDLWEIHLKQVFHAMMMQGYRCAYMVVGFAIVRKDVQKIRDSVICLIDDCHEPVLS